MNFVWAFLVGGLICVVGQLLIDLTKLTPARILVLYVVAGVVLSALGWYDPLVDFAGAGATVPLIGFGHLLAQGVMDSVAQSGLVGALTGGFTAAAGGVTRADPAAPGAEPGQGTTKNPLFRRTAGLFESVAYLPALSAALARRETLREAVFL